MADDFYKKIEHYYLATGKDDRPQEQEKNPDTLGDVLEGSKPVRKIDDGWSGGIRDAYVISSQEYPSILTIPDEGLFKNLKITETGEADIPEMDGFSVWCHYCVPVGGYASMLDYTQSSQMEYMRAWEIVNNNEINPAAGRSGEVVLVELQKDRLYGEVYTSRSSESQDAADGDVPDPKQGPESKDKGKHLDSKGNPKDRLRPYDKSSKHPTPGGPAQKAYAGYLKNTSSPIKSSAKVKVEPLDHFRYKWKNGADSDSSCYLLYKGDELTEWMKIHNVAGAKIVTATQTSRIVVHPAVLEMYIAFLESWPGDMGHVGIAHNANHGLASFRNSGKGPTGGPVGPHGAGIAIDITSPKCRGLSGQEKRDYIKKQLFLAQQAGFTRFGISNRKGLAHMDVSKGHYMYPNGMWWTYFPSAQARRLGSKTTSFVSKSIIIPLMRKNRKEVDFMPKEFLTAAPSERLGGKSTLAPDFGKLGLTV